MFAVVAGTEMLKHSFGFNAIESSEDLKSGRSHASMSDDHLNLRSFATGPLLPPPAFVTTTKHRLRLCSSATLLFPDDDEKKANLVLEEDEEDDEVDAHDDAEENARGKTPSNTIFSRVMCVCSA